MSGKKSDKMKWVDILLAILVVVLAGACIVLFYERRADKAREREEKLRAQIQETLDEETWKKKTVDFFKKSKVNAEISALRVERELTRIAEGDYDVIVLDTGAINWSSDWFSTFLARNAYVNAEKISTPEELARYLDASIENCLVKDIYIEADPSDLEACYYYEHRYENSYDFFTQKMQDCFWSFMDSYPDVTFHIVLPIKSIARWKSLPVNELEAVKEDWDQFIKFTSRYNNQVIHCATGEEWIAGNSLCFDDFDNLTEDMYITLFLNYVARDYYNVDYNDFDNIWASISRMITEDTYRPNLGDYDLVFIGDSILAREMQNELSIPGIISGLTGARTYNLANSGTTMADLGIERSFTEIAQYLADRKKPSSTGEDDRCANDFSRFYEDKHSDRKQIVFVMFGFNDYVNGAKTGSADEADDVSTFYGATTKGIELLKKSNPEAEIVLISPIVTEMFNNGKDAAVDGGYTLLKYISLEEALAKANDVAFINAYKNSGITNKNCQTYLGDMVHPTHQGNYLISRMIIEYLTAESPKK